VDPHRLAEARSLAYHRAIAERLPNDPAIVSAARARVERWLAEGRSAHYAGEWQKVLAAPPTEIRAVLVADTEYARALRQTTPFAGAIGPRERWRIWKEVRSGVRE
jgi:hypothetical protein